MKLINISKLSESQKNLFLDEYFLILKKWKKEFKPTLKERVLAFFSRKVWDLSFSKKDWSGLFNEDIKKRIELKKFANNQIEKKIIDCWIGMDRETIKWKPIIIRIYKLQGEQEKFIKEFLKQKNLDNAIRLLNSQIKLLNLFKRMNKSIKYKTNLQNKIREFSIKLNQNDKSSIDIILLGVLTDILSRNEGVIGTKSALSYGIIKKSKPYILDFSLSTKRLEIKIKRDENKIKILERDIKELLKKIKNEI